MFKTLIYIHLEWDVSFTNMHNFPIHHLQNVVPTIVWITGEVKAVHIRKVYAMCGFSL